MIDIEQLNQILAFVAKRWTDLSRDPDNKAVKTLPGNFWMNSVGGPSGKGRWITTLMYTEDETEANQFKEVLKRWSAKPTKTKSPDLIQINQTKET